MNKPKTEDELKKAAEEAAEKSGKDMVDLQSAVKTQTEENAKLLKGMQALAGVVKSQKDAIESMQGSFQKLSDEQGTQRKTPASGNDQDVEALSRKEFLHDVILPELGTMLDTKLKTVSDRLESVSSEFETKAVRDEVSSIRGNRPDFDHWKQEVAKELRGNPNLSVEDAYLLARTRDPDKSKKVDEEIATKQKEEAERSAAEQGSNFGGMRPSGGGEVEERTDMEPDEAADAAWDEVEDALGGREEMQKALGIDTI